MITISQFSRILLVTVGLLYSKFKFVIKMACESVACLRSGTAHVIKTIEALAASTELRRQQLEQQRVALHAAVDARVDTLQATLELESTGRTSILERQLVEMDNALEKQLQLEQEQDTLVKAPENAAAAFVVELVEVALINVQFDSAALLSAISVLGIVHGAQAASDVFERGLSLLLGRSVGPKPDGAAAAFVAFVDAAALGNTTAMGYAAEQLYEGFGVERDAARATRMFKEAAANGDVFSRALVIQQRNPQLAFSLFQHAVERGHVAAEDHLGVCFHHGVGCPLNNSAAYTHFQRSATQGYASAEYNLAVCYTNGIGINKDPVKAAAWYQRAAEQGFVHAQLGWANCLTIGMGVEKDPVQAAVWYKLAAEKGNVRAQLQFGRCYNDGAGVEKNFAQAAVWYHRAADQGYSNAQFTLGVCYTDGRGVNRNPVQAVVWFTLAAQQGHACAQLHLGRCFFDGVGVAKDVSNASNAVVWYTRAAEQGHSHAQFILGKCYANGTGVEHDLERALAWYKRASDLGSTAAKHCLEKIHETLYR